VISRPLIRLALIALPALVVLIVPAQIKSLAGADLRPAWSCCPAS
jgi:transposase